MESSSHLKANEQLKHKADLKASNNANFNLNNEKYTGAIKKTSTSDKKTKNHKRKWNSYTARRQRNLQRKIDLTMDLSSYFIEASMQMIIKFLKDDARTELVFRNLTSDEFNFLQDIELIIDRKIYGTFDNDCRSVAVELQNTWNNAMEFWSVKIEEKDPNIISNARQIAVLKIPLRACETVNLREYARCPTISHFETLQCLKRAHRNVKGVEYRFLKAISISSDSDDSFIGSDEVEGAKSVESEQHSAVDNDKPDTKGKRYISFPIKIPIQKAGSDDAQFTDDPTESNTTIEFSNDIDPLTMTAQEWEMTKIKTKLFECMSVPLESDKAMRMMRLMGWQGGALGARGDGITEPIMPHMNITTGVGLGHSKYTTLCKVERTRTPAEFRIHLLENILELIIGKEIVIEISYEEAVAKSEEQFLGPAMTAINTRKRFEVRSEEEFNLMKEILEHMRYAPDMMIDVHLPDTKKSIALTKTPPAKKPKPDKNDSQQLINYDPLDIDRLCDIHRERTKIKRTTSALAYKVLFLVKILEFLKSVQYERELRFNCTLNTMQCRYIVGAVISVNKKESIGMFRTKVEDDIFQEMLACTHKYCYLNINIRNVCRKFVLQKIYTELGFMNLALRDTLMRESGNFHNEIMRERDAVKDIEYHCKKCDKLSPDGTAARVDDKVNTEAINSYNKCDKTSSGNVDLNSKNDSILSNEDNASVGSDKVSNERVNDLEGDKKLVQEAINSNDDYVSTKARNSDSNCDKTFDNVDVCNLNHSVLPEEDITSFVSDNVLYKRSNGLESDKKLENEMQGAMNVDKVSTEPVNSNCDKTFYNVNVINIIDFVNDNIAVASDNVSNETDNELEGDKKLEDRMRESINDKDFKINIKAIDSDSNCDKISDNVDVSKINDSLFPEEDNITVAKCYNVSNEEGDEKLENEVQEAINFSPNEDVEHENAKSEEYSEDKEVENGKLNQQSCTISRSSSDSEIVKRSEFQPVIHIKTVCIVPVNYPDEKISVDTAKIVQKLISEYIDKFEDSSLLLQCHGIRHGAFLYSCHNKNSMVSLENIVSVANDVPLKILDLIHVYKDKVKVAIKFNSLIEVDFKKMFNRIELCNKGLKTDAWNVQDQQMNDESLILVVEIDQDSLEFISKANFALFVGVDRVQICIISD